MEFLARSTAAVLLVACTFDAAYRLAWRLVRDGEVLLRWSAAGVIGMWLATVGFHALFALSLFTPAAALGSVLVVWCAARRLAGSATTRALLARDRAYLAEGAAAALARRALTVVVPFAALLLARSLILPPMAWDWVTYHGVRAALFAQGAGWTFPDAPGAWGLCRHYFAGSEVLAAWTLLPFHSDLLTSLADWVQWIALGVAVAAVGRRLGLGFGSATVAACGVLFIPTVRLQVPSGYADVELAFAIVTSAACGMTFLRGAEPAHAWLAFAAAGLAVGIKPNGALPGGAVCALVLAAALVSPRHRLSAASLAVALVLAVLPALPWMAIAIRDTGAPLSPMPVEVSGVPLGVASAEMELLLDQDVTGAYTWAREREALASGFGEPTESEALGLLTLIPLSVFPLGALAGWLRRRRPEVLVVVLTAVAAVVFHYLPGLSVPRLIHPTSAPRYALGAVALAVPTGFLAFARRPRWETWYAHVILAVTAFYAMWYATFGMADFEGAYLWRVLAYLGLGGALAGGIGARWHWTAGAGMAVALAWFGALQLESARPTVRSEALQSSKELHHINRYWVDALPLVDDGAAPRRIAVTAGTRASCDHWFAYFFLGRDLQNRVVYVPTGAGGKVLHVRPGEDPAAGADRASWLELLGASGASDVLSFRPRSIEQEWMEADAERFERLAGDEDWGLFRVLR